MREKIVTKIATLILITNIWGNGIVSQILSFDKLFIAKTKESCYSFVLLTVVSFVAKHTYNTTAWYENVGIFFALWYVIIIGSCLLRKIDVANKSRAENEATYSVISLTYKILFTYAGTLITKNILPGIFICALMVFIFKTIANKKISTMIINENEWYLAAGFCYR